MRFFAVMLLSLALPLKAEDKTLYRSGVHFDVLNPAYELPASEKTQVYEFFSYSCGGCAQFEPLMERIEQTHHDKIEIVRVPVVFNPQWEITARTYYTAEVMGLLDKSHKAIFNAIHGQGKRFRKIEDVADWFASSFGTDKEAFVSTAQSFAVDSRLRSAQKMAKKVGVQRTPTLMIGGKYIPKTANLNQKSLLDVVSYLVNKSAGS
ncbi:thiol:disulfide interchange protein DsbA/DsbL [Marinicella sp. W31]|uniref:thiol:disulfide interchange protein DsbA/DsbL n=1 Tax=Marinicella sp. W31 TaxID=3023713 RepID=UPI003756FC26